MNLSRKLKILFANYGSKNHIRSFFTKQYNKECSNNKKVLIYAGIGHMYMSYFEILIYHLLRKEGYQVDYVIYDENIPINEVITKNVVEYQGKEKFWNNSVSKARKLLKLANVDYSFINSKRDEVAKEIAKIPNDLNSIFSYSNKGIDFGNIVKGTMYRYYKSLSFENDSVTIAKKFLFTCLTNYYEIRERFQTKDYEYVFFSHGIYVTWEPIARYCEQKNVNFICYDRAKTKSTININFNQSSPDWNFSSAWERFKEKELNESEENILRKYIKDRELQKNDVYSYNFTFRSNDIPKLKEHLGIPVESFVITLFTNLIWDAANVARDIAFQNMLDCVIQTIEKYRNIENIHIVLRTHPAEKVLGTKERYGTLVREYFRGQLPNNVTVIEPEMNVNSFSVIDLSDVGVVNTSTVGLEFAMLGKPIILISETHYRNKGFTYDASSSKEYFEILEKLIKKPILLPNQVKLAEKYFYIMMFLYQHKTPLEYKNGIFNKYLYSSIEYMSKDISIKRILDRIKSKEFNDFVYWP